ncbi:MULTISPECIES: cell wall-active antibiotics response protein LiaF [Enterococcus]|uniref:Uncharacterized protein n=1 Tax=Enterococcus sulfureus ATCC 49903 TaxID=1140003 RepID=S0L6E5_9ENTE|nr:cell wall-active antibiotics response protein LiaF [Enterococcus sulfureus]EOT47056.1 hypothetical protein OMY_01306 [Enterococcus sulfureus ATCC 49903]EOT83649.1 hypothetical protein I573_01374 [Enterococcus sulfureus ATCC 49903]
MKNSWKFFWIVSSILVIASLWQLVQRIDLLMLLVLGSFIVYFGSKRKHKRMWQIIGGLLVLNGLINTSSVVFLMIFVVIFLGLKGFELTQAAFFTKQWFGKKEIKIIESQPPNPHNQTITKKPFIGDQRIGTKIYEWDDISLSLFSGDTIIDLGNTLLPKKDNVIIVRKFFGKTRILVPTGIEVMVQHQALLGKVSFDEQTVELHNEEYTAYSQAYDEGIRRIKILSQSAIGDLEVIRI